MCGNFGIIFLDPRFRDKVLPLLREMIRITMMRGAQSAGLVTYQRAADGGAGFSSRLRKRVVNGKRTDLCDLLMKKYKSELEAANIAAPALFQGHTRFATSSIANFEGCHPHQWSPAKPMAVWSADGEGRWPPRTTGAEAYITHNGDLDFFEVHGVVYPLEDVQLLMAVLRRPPSRPPARPPADSACRRRCPRPHPRPPPPARWMRARARAGRPTSAPRSLTLPHPPAPSQALLHAPMPAPVAGVRGGAIDLLRLREGVGGAPRRRRPRVDAPPTRCRRRGAPRCSRRVVALFEREWAATVAEID